MIRGSPANVVIRPNVPAVRSIRIAPVEVVEEIERLDAELQAVLDATGTSLDNARSTFQKLGPLMLLRS